MDPDNDKAPLFGNWNYWYAGIIIFLAILVVFFSFFTKIFS
jgi:hypothetical protein